MKDIRSNNFNKLYKSLKFSWYGLHVAWKKQLSFRQECFLILVLLPLVFYLSLPLEFKLFLIILFLLLLSVELINSALETIIDRISLEEHLLSKEAKDLGSAAVFMIVLMNIVAWFYALYKVSFQ